KEVSVNEDESTERHEKGINNIKIQIGEGKDINIEIPFPVITSSAVSSTPITEEIKGEKSSPEEEKELRRLTRKYFKIDKVEFGHETKIDGTTLIIREDAYKEAIDSQELVVDMKVDIITPDRYNEFSNTIMDVQPIATKEEGELGEG